MKATRRQLHDREAQLDDVGRLLDGAHSTGGGVVTVSGAPGTGKSALLEEAAHRAAALRMNVLRARGTRLERDFSHGGTVQLFERWLSRAAPAERAQVLDGPAGSVARLLERGELAGPGQRPTEAELRELAAAVAGIRPLVMLVDDAELLDLPSLSFLIDLGQTAHALPLAILAARDAAADERGALLGRLDECSGGQPIELPPLGPEAVAAVVREEIPDADDGVCSDCLRLTAGNPGALRELLVELTREGEGLAPGGLSQGAVSRPVLAALARLPAAEQELARALAVLGSDSPSEASVAELAGIAQGELAGAIEGLRAGAILDSGGKLEFSHPLAEAAVLEGIPRGRRSDLHRRAAALLTAAGAGAHATAEHLAQALPEGDPVVAAMLRRAAAEALAGGDPGSAGRFLRRSLEEPPPPDEKAATLRELGAAEAAAGEAGAADRIADALTAADSPRARAEALLLLAEVRRDRGDWSGALAALEEALGECDGSGADALSARVESELVASAALVPNRDEAAVERGERLLERSRSGAPESPVVRLAAALHLTRAGERREEAVELTELALAEGVDGASLWIGAEVMLAAERYPDALALSERALEDARRRGSVSDATTALHLRSRALLALGRIEAAVADAERVVEAGRHGWGHSLPGAHAVLAEALLVHGEPNAAAESAGELDGQAWSSAPSWNALVGARGAINAKLGRMEEALAAFVAQGEIVGTANLAAGPSWRSRASITLTVLGRAGEAEARAEEEIELAHRWGAPARVGVGLCALGMARGGQAGVATLREATVALEESPAHLAHWQVQLELGSALRRSGRRIEAREPLRAVAREAAEAGASALASRAGEELALSGEATRNCALGGIESLTPGELRVARLAAGGMTNKQIAEALHVSQKAVQWHLRNTYRKLEIDGRAGLPEDLLA